MHHTTYSERSRRSTFYIFKVAPPLSRGLAALRASASALRPRTGDRRLHYPLPARSVLKLKIKYQVIKTLCPFVTTGDALSHAAQRQSHGPMVQGTATGERRARRYGARGVCEVGWAQSAATRRARRAARTAGQPAASLLVPRLVLVRVPSAALAAAAQGRPLARRRRACGAALAWLGFMGLRLGVCGCGCGCGWGRGGGWG